MARDESKVGEIKENVDKAAAHVARSRWVERLARVSAEAPGAAHQQQVAEHLASHDLGPRDVCVHGFPEAPVGQRSATLAVAVVEPATGWLHVHAGRACEARPGTWWSG